jgi:hypothetical protein
MVLSREGYYYRKTAIKLPIIVYTRIIPIIVCARIISIMRFLEVSLAFFYSKDFVSEDSGFRVVNYSGISISGFSNIVIAIG